MNNVVVYSATALCAIVACSWYANDIIRAFYNPFTPVNTKYVHYDLKLTLVYSEYRVILA